MADKKEFRIFLISEYEEEEQYLCDMAKKGYIFEKVTFPGVYYFKKSEPTNMIYRIDFNSQKKEDRDSYLLLFKDYGWDYIQDLNEFSYFCKLDDGSDDEIFSDNQSRIAMLERINSRKMMPILVIFLCCVIPQVMRMVIWENFTDPVSIVIYIFLLVLMGLYIYLIARCTAGFRKLKKKYDVV